jgi:hypothetical protein
MRSGVDDHDWRLLVSPHTRVQAGIGDTLVGRRLSHSEARRISHIELTPSRHVHPTGNPAGSESLEKAFSPWPPCWHS